MDRLVRGGLLAGLFLVAGVLLVGTAGAAPPPDPDSDVIGWENGYWHNESIDVDRSDGLSEAEREAYVSRAMARVEVIREREFNETVPVEVVSREEYGNQTRGNASDAYREWNNQVWEALFVVGEDEDVLDLLHSTSTAATTGGYFIHEDRITIVTDGPEDTAIDRGTLVHELAHALQDQHFDLSNVTANTTTQDEQLSTNALVEGDARYVEYRYEERCGTDWECVPARSGGGSSGGIQNRGLLYTLYYPYSDGPPYVHSLVQREGWAAVDAQFENPPNSTEQTTHVTEEPPVPLEVRDEARGGWTTFPEQGRNGTDTAGEASMFVMLWYQSWKNGADTVPPESIGETDDRYDTFDYAATPTAGWGNDAILPYRRETTAGTEHGYVWVTEWDTEVDAQQFGRAYRAVLAAHDARKVGPRTWVIDSGPYADAFRVARDGRTLTVVNAPRTTNLEDLRPSLPALSTPESPTAEPRSPMEPGETGGDGRLTAAPAQPGFGLLAGALGVLGWSLLRRRRRT